MSGNVYARVNLSHRNIGRLCITAPAPKLGGRLRPVVILALVLCLSGRELVGITVSVMGDYWVLNTQVMSATAVTVCASVLE